MKGRIFVGVPAGDGVITAQLAAFLCNLPADRFQVALLAAVRPRVYARNLVAGKFLASKCDALWFLDADLVPAPNLLKLADLEGDIVGGTYPCAAPDPDDRTGAVRINYLSLDMEWKGVRCERSAGVIEVGAVPFGCCLISRRVLEDRAMRLDPDAINNDVPAFFQDRSEPNGRITWTDDYDFCYRAKGLGYSVKLDTDVRCGHVKSIDLNTLIGPAMEAMWYLLDEAAKVKEMQHAEG